MATDERLKARVEVLTVALEAAIDALQTLAMDLEAGLEGEELEKAVEAALAMGKAAKAVLRSS